MPVRADCAAAGGAEAAATRRRVASSWEGVRRVISERELVSETFAGRREAEGGRREAEGGRRARVAGSVAWLATAELDRLCGGSGCTACAAHPLACVNRIFERIMCHD